MSNTGVLKCQNGYKIKWKIDDFESLQKSVAACKNSRQIIESGHFIMWDCNWKFKLVLEEFRRFKCTTVSISLVVLDVESWDKKGLSLTASLDVIYRAREKSENNDLYSLEFKDHNIDYVKTFSFPNTRRIRDFDFTWNILQEVSSARFQHQILNAKRIQRMVNKWGQMLDDTESHDVKILCEGVGMSAHKMILSGSSPVFKAMFQAGMKETRESLVEVTVGSPEAVKLMLRWIYGCTEDIEEKEYHALDLFKVAHYYDLAELMEECEVILVGRICKENAIQILIEADLLGAKELKDSAIQFIIRNKSDFWKDLTTKLNENLFLEILMAQ